MPRAAPGRRRRRRRHRGRRRGDRLRWRRDRGHGGRRTGAAREEEHPRDAHRERRGKDPGDHLPPRSRLPGGSPAERRKGRRGGRPPEPLRLAEGVLEEAHAAPPLPSRNQRHGHAAHPTRFDPSKRDAAARTTSSRSTRAALRTHAASRARSHSWLIRRGTPRDRRWMQPLGRGGQEGRSGGPRDAHPVLDVPGGFPQVQRQDRRPHGDPLVELAQLRKAELFLQLLLSEQDDLEELALLRLQVREEPNLLQERRGEVLRLVDDQDRAPSDFRLGENEGTGSARPAGPSASRRARSRRSRRGPCAAAPSPSARCSRPGRSRTAPATAAAARGRRWSCRPRCRPSPR